jgi:DNA polymerase-1
MRMEILIPRTEAEIDAAYKRLADAACLGCDTETSGLNSRFGRLFSIQFSDGEISVLVPLSENVGLGSLARLLAEPSITKVFHNAKFDLDFLNAAGLETVNVFDTMLAEKVLTRGAHQSASLAETLYRYFAVDLDKTQRKKFHSRWDGVWTDELVEYALADVLHLPKLREEQTAWLERLALSAEYDAALAKLFAS